MLTVNLEIVSPDKTVYQKDVRMVIVRSQNGELGILPKHAPMIAGLLPHAMRIKLADTDKEDLVAISGGFIEVQPNKITVLATTAEVAANIDVERAKRAYHRAKERLEKIKTASLEEKRKIDSVRAHAALERAIARLKTTNNPLD